MATYKILDISKYQPNVDYAKVAKAVDGVILRIGITYWGKQNMGIDPCFEKHYAGFKAVGCPIGVYYYSASDSVAVAENEAEYTLQLLKGKQFELPIYMDVEEGNRMNKLSKQTLTNIVDTYCSIIEKAGYFVGVYANTSWFTTKLDHAFLSKKYTIWLADYRLLPNKTLKRDMHQYTSSGTVSGISGGVDLSRCYVDFPTVIKNAGLNGFDKKPVIQTFTVKGTKGDIYRFKSLADALEIKDYTITNCN